MMSLGQRSQGTLASVPAPRPLVPFDLKNLFSQTPGAPHVPHATGQEAPWSKCLT